MPDVRSAQPANWRGEGDDAATAALAGLTLASVWGLTRVFATHDWVGPVVVTVLFAHLVSWAMRRLRLPAPVAIVGGLVATFLAATWTLLGQTTAAGVPTGKTFSAAADALRTAHDQVSAVAAPVQPIAGFVLFAALGSGVLAVIADWLAFRARSSLWGSLPAFGLFVTCCVVGTGPGRQWAVILETGALLLFVLAHRISTSGSRLPWLGGVRAGVAGWALPSGALVAAAAMITVLVVAPATSNLSKKGIFGGHGVGEGGGPRQVANPIVDLHTRLIQLSDVEVFAVTSPVASYWRLTSLDTFTGDAWVSTNSYRGFGDRLPGIVSPPAGTRTVTQQFSIQGLDSVWLPAAFNPVSVTGVRGVGYDPASSSLITSHRTSNGLRYTVTSYQYLATLDPAQLAAVTPPPDDAAVARYLALPSDIPRSVYQLARSLTAGKQTEYDKALALQSYFDGPSFAYSLNPPDDGFGIDALTNFLFSTRTGYCQQFAGAYAVLARAVGLPTRLAVGFTTGSNLGGDVYQVLDADAHTWPEVYFGPKIGWVPFEPTKSFSDPAASRYAPGISRGGAGGSTDPIPSPVTPRGGTATTLQGSGATVTPKTVPSLAAPRQSARGMSGGLEATLVISGLLVLWVTGNTALRRLRWRFRHWRARQDARAAVLSYWRDVGEVLEWWGVARQPGDTDNEFAQRAGRSLASDLREPSPWVTGGIARLAGLANQASFAPAVKPGAPDEAALVAAEIRQQLVRKASWRRLLMWGLIQRPGRAAAST